MTIQRFDKFLKKSKVHSAITDVKHSHKITRRVNKDNNYSIYFLLFLNFV